MESDEQIRTVPEFGGEISGTSASGREANSVAVPDRAQAPVGDQSQRKRGRTPADKENKRLKRLLRNSFSSTKKGKEESQLERIGDNSQSWRRRIQNSMRGSPIVVENRGVLFVQSVC